MPFQNAQDFPLWLNAGLFLIAAAIVWGAGTRLARYVDTISDKTGLGKVFVGMLLLGVITSLPEIANVLTASITGNPALAVNNLLGSAAINVLLLAIADAAIGREAVTGNVAQPSTLMMSTLCIMVLVAVAMALTTGDVEVFGVGLWSVGLCLFSIGAFWLTARYEDRAAWKVTDEGRDDDEDAGGGEDSEEGADKSLRSLIIKTVIAGVVILAAGYTLSQTGDALAEQTGIGTGMVGFALIGLATSLPELSSVVEAIRLRQYEMAFGQVLGTNFVNLSLILLADLVYQKGPVINELGDFEVISALLGATLIGVFLVGLLERRDRTVMKMGWDSLAVMVLFAGGLVLLYFVGGTSQQG